MNAFTIPPSDDPTLKSGSWLVEVVLFLALLGTINILFFPEDLGFTAASPHPLWLVILPVAARYGFGPGVIAGLGCAALQFGLVLHMIADPTWTDLSRFSVWRLPFLFILMGAVMGELREVQKRRYATLRTRYLEMVGDATDLEERYTLLLRSKEELDLRIITQEQSLSTLYDSARSLRLLEEKAILPALLDLLKEQLNIRQAAAYLFVESELTLISHIGPHEDIPHKLTLRQKVATKVITNRQTWTIQDDLHQAEAGPQFLIMAPVLAADQKTVLGILAIRDIPFEKFTPSGVKMVSLLADWGGTSLDNARQFSTIKEQLITDESSLAFTFSYFQARILEELNRSKRYNTVFSLLYIRLPTATPSSQPPYSVDSAIFLISRSLRSVDIVFRSNQPEEVLVMLPSTDNVGAQHTITKLLFQLNNLADMALSNHTSSTEAKIGSATFSRDIDTPEALLEAASRDLHTAEYPLAETNLQERDMQPSKA